VPIYNIRAVTIYRVYISLYKKATVSWIVTICIHPKLKLLCEKIFYVYRVLVPVQY